MEKFERSQLMDQLKCAKENCQIQEDPEGFMTEKQIKKFLPMVPVTRDQRGSEVGLIQGRHVERSPASLQ